MADDDDEKLERALARLSTLAAEGKCYTCEVKHTAVRQVGRCVYAEPCGHRIGQGDAKRVAKALGVPVVASR